jgi:hypothetical protein
LLKSREAEVLRFIIKVALMGTLLMAAITPPVRPLDLSSQPENQVEADPGVASCANSVKKALDVIEETVAEMASSRQPRTSL